MQHSRMLYLEIIVSIVQRDRETERERETETENIRGGAIKCITVPLSGIYGKANDIFGNERHYSEIVIMYMSV